VFVANNEDKNGVPAAVFVIVAEAVAAAALVNVEVVKVVDVTRATLPLPVEPNQDATVPFDERKVFAPPIVVRPVPPLATGRAVPEYVIAIAGVVVGFVTATLKNPGTVAETDVTPPGDGVVQERVVPSDVRTTSVSEL
jgi:hypothetical protein